MHLGRTVRAVLLIVLAAASVSCQTTEDLLSVRGSGSRFFGSVLNADLAARQPAPEQNQGLQRIGPADPPPGEVYTGSGYVNGQGGPFVPAGTSETAGRGTYRLNFENADLGEVVRAILGDALGRNFVIDTEVSGRVTLVSARPVAQEDLLPILETILRMNQAALVDTGSIYRIVFDSEVGTVPLIDRNDTRSGYGLTVVPLRYVSARTMVGLIEGFATRSESLRVDTSRNLVLIAGTAAERQTAVETINNFDTDWMADQSVAIYPVGRVRPETLVPELERIFETREGQPGADLIQFVPMSRMKAVLVVSKRPDLIRQAGIWVSRLDRQSPETDVQVHVYRVKYRDAKMLVQILSGIFTGSTATGIDQRGDRPGDQIDPRASLFQTSVEGETGDNLNQQPGLSTDQQDLGLTSGNTFDLTDTGRQPGAGDVLAGPATGGNDRIRFSADTANNSIVVYADGETYRKILAALRQIDVPPLQVAINVVIAEIRLNDQLRYGVQYFLKSGDDGSIGLFNTIANNISRELPGFNFVIGSERSPDVIISAFDEITDVQVLSSPSLVVLENQTATLQVGENVPVTTRQSTSNIDPDAPTVNEVEYRDTGIILNVTPRVADNGVISMTIQQEISNIASGGQTLTPTFAKRRISSAVSVVSNQTVLLGGLISERSERNDTGIPGLHRLETIGSLFGTKRNQSDRTELIVLIRPVVIRQGQDAQHVAEELRARMWEMNTRARD